MRQLALDLPSRLDEGDTVVVVLLHARGDGEDVGIENDVFGREPGAIHEQVIGALAYGDPTLDGVRLALLVECHDDRGSPVATQLTRMVEEYLLAFLEADGVDDALALH